MTVARVALDSNVLIYWLRLVRKPEDQIKVVQAEAVIDALLGRDPIVVPGQALGEAYNVLVKSGMTRDEANASVLSTRRAFKAIAPTSDAYWAALNLAARHRLQVWDALIIAASAEAGCDLLLSEDMQDGFVVGGLTVVNPFAAAPHSKLAALLDA